LLAQAAHGFRAIHSASSIQHRPVGQVIAPLFQLLHEAGESRGHPRSPGQCQFAPQALVAAKGRQNGPQKTPAVIDELQWALGQWGNGSMKWLKIKVALAPSPSSSTISTKALAEAQGGSAIAPAAYTGLTHRSSTSGGLSRALTVTSRRHSGSRLTPRGATDPPGSG